MTRGLNARQLVETIRVEKPGVKAVDLTYHYGPDGRISEKIDRAGAPVLDPPGVRTIEAEYGPDNRLSRMRDTGAGGAWRTYAYDNRGNVAGDGRLTFAYDAAEQPTSMGGAAAGAFVYDGNLKRVKQTLAGETVYSVYALSGAILYRDNATTSEATDYIRAAGQTLARLRGSVTTFPHQDHLGSPIAETGLAGAVNWREAYAAYGEKRLDPVGNRDNEGFTGHIDDAASGLTYMQARYYDPVIGRFLSNDPVGFSIDKPQQFNRYSYTWNDPINKVDPDGNLPVIPAAILVARAGYTGYKAYRAYRATRAMAATAGVAGSLTRAATSPHAAVGTAAAVAAAAALATDAVTPEGRPIRDHGKKGTGGEYIAGKGWTGEQVDDVVNNPAGTEEATDRQANRKTGRARNEPATRYVDSDGYGVIVNDETGEVIAADDRELPPPENNE